MGTAICFWRTGTFRNNGGEHEDLKWWAKNLLWIFQQLPNASKNLVRCGYWLSGSYYSDNRKVICTQIFTEFLQKIGQILFLQNVFTGDNSCYCSKMSKERFFVDIQENTENNTKGVYWNRLVCCTWQKRRGNIYWNI